MKFGIAISAFLIVISAAFGCSSSTTNTNSIELPIPDTTTSVSVGDIRIGTLDMIKIEVLDVETLNGVYQVGFDGRLKLPLIGEVSAIGMTPTELSYDLQQRYGVQYLQDPDINVVIVESMGRRITLDGAVRNPGLYPVTGRVSLLQAVALAGGTTSSANPKKVVVFRQIDAERHAAAFNLAEIRNGTIADPEIFGNDIIVVDGSDIGETYSNVLRSIPLAALFLAF